MAKYHGWHSLPNRFSFKNGGEPGASGKTRFYSRVVAYDDDYKTLGTLDLEKLEVNPADGVSKQDAIEAFKGLTETLMKITGLKSDDEIAIDSLFEPEPQVVAAPIVVEPVAPVIVKPDIVDVEWSDLAMNTPGQAISKMVKTEKSYEIGFQGELMTAGVLSSLSGNVLHSVQVTKLRDIDHILVHSTGVYVINTKNYRTRLEVIGTTAGNKIKNAGYVKDWINDSSLDRDTVRSIITETLGITIPVVHLIVSWSEIENEIGDPHVVEGKNLVSYIEGKDQIVSEMAQQEVFHVLRKSSTWKISNPS